MRSITPEESTSQSFIKRSKNAILLQHSSKQDFSNISSESNNVKHYRSVGKPYQTSYCPIVKC